MSFLSCFEDEPIVAPRFDQGGFRFAPGVKPRDYGLRWFQGDAKAAGEDALTRVRSAMIVMATGLGKTQTFAAVAGDWIQGDVLVLAHRDELVGQAAKRIEKMTGEQVEIEQADQRASYRARIVVGSVQSVMQQRRLDRLGPDRFGLIIPDEFHHYVAASFRKPLDHFHNAKILGFTATPDRADEKAMGKIVDEVAYVMDIGQGIEQGYLVPIHGRGVSLDEIDLSGVDTRAGDLVASQLDEAMLKATEGIVKTVLEMYPNRKGPAFFPGIKSAELACQRFNALKPGCATFIHAKTPEDERKEIVRDVHAGRYQFLCNVGIATEGFDWPGADIVIGGRPTKSRSLYAQMAGRGTRVLPGVVDHIPGKEGAADRRAAVAGSEKPHMVLLDFCGNDSKHSLVGPEDLLGGDYTEDEIKLAKKKTEGLGGNALQALEAARAEIRALAHAVQSRVKSTVRDFDPFNAFGIDREEIARVNARFGYVPASDKQRETLRKFGIDPSDLEGLSRQAAGRMMEKFVGRIEKGLASFKQLRLLRSMGVLAPADTSMANASAAISHAKANPKWDPKRMDQILHERREPGSDG